MNKRDFLKGAFAVAATAPMTSLFAKAGEYGDKASDLIQGPQVTRKAYKNTKQTLPMLGFGMMRLDFKRFPELSEAMVKRAFEAGVNYFDTAYFYQGGESERFVGRCLSKYPRDSYYLADKFPVGNAKKPEDLERIFNEQLDRTKAGYFDFYLLHALNDGSWQKVVDLKILEFVKQKKAEGKVRRIGFSFHGSPKGLQTIVDAYDWEFVQIQLNYLDWINQKANEQYDILTKKGIPVIVMEPLRGGVLANLSTDATELLKKANFTESPASLAFRYVGSLPNVLITLSGMVKAEHLEENIKTFTDFKPLNDSEKALVENVRGTFRKVIPCTACKYCIPCPSGVEIPTIFKAYNEFRQSGNVGKFRRDYHKIPEDGRADACITCKKCLQKCPQHINIPEQLAKIAKDKALK